MMISGREWRWMAAWAAALVATVVLPYAIAYLAVPDGLYFAGFLSNPEDGHSYLAKMRQGWRGEWRFRLPFAPEPHATEFLFTYYLLLGHIARWARMPLITVLHLARAVNSALLLAVLYYAASLVFADVGQRRFAFLTTALGSGLGWLTSFVIGLTVDLWVPEGYVFYSMFANAHFPLAIALTVLALLWSSTPWHAVRVDGRRVIGVALCSAALGIVQPFCLLTVGVVVLIYTALRWAQGRRPPWHEIVSGLAVGAAGLPFVINAYLASTRNPAFAAWSAQNQTRSPPPWDYAAAYGIVLLLALVGAWRAAQRRRGSDLFLLTWVLCTVVLLYLPFSLQRRLVLGLIVPLGALATTGWFALPAARRPRPAVVWVTASLTNVFLIGMSMAMAMTGNRVLFMTQDEHEALRWLEREAPHDALVAAAPETGLYIPAWSGQRVYYGHRFETTNADLRREQVERFFAAGDVAALPYRPDYVFYGPREQALRAGDWTPDGQWQALYKEGTVAIYAVPQE